MPRINFPPSKGRWGANVAGFADAQNLLRQELGVDCTFLIPTPPTWPAGTPMDPETGKPFDPFLDPTTPASDTPVIVRCSFVHAPLREIDPRFSPFGGADVGDAALIVPADSYPSVKDATRVVIGDETWDIQRFRYDIALTVERWIAYLERA